MIGSYFVASVLGGGGGGCPQHLKPMESLLDPNAKITECNIPVGFYYSSTYLKMFLNPQP